MAVGGISEGIGGGNQPPYEAEKKTGSKKGASNIDTDAAAAASSDTTAGKTGKVAAAASLQKDDEGVLAAARHLQATHISDKAAKAAAKAASVGNARHITNLPYETLHNVFEQSLIPLSRKDLFRFLIALPVDERKKYLLANPPVTQTIIHTTRGDLQKLPPRIRELITSPEIAHTVTTLPDLFCVNADKDRENNIEQIVTLFPSLTALKCNSITDKHLALVVTQLQHLESLTVKSSPGVTEKGLAQLVARKATLKELTLDKFVQITSVAALSTLENLVALDLSCSKVARLQGLETLTKLERLDLMYCDGIRDQELAALIGHGSLRSLTLGGALLTDECAASIGRIPYLSKLYVFGPKLTAQFFGSLPKMKTLEHLTLSRDVPITDQTVSNLQNVPNLTTLGMSCSLSDQGMAALSALSKLQSLTVTFINPQLTQAGISSLSRSLPQLTHLNINGLIGGDEAVAHLATMNKLEFLRLFTTGITSAGVLRLGSLPNLRVLRLVATLDLDNTFADEFIRNPKAFEHLEYLVLSSTGISREKAEELSRARPQLRVDYH